MKILFPKIALLFVGCGKSPEEMIVGEKKKRPTEMVVGEWNTGGTSSMKLRDDGVMEATDSAGVYQGEWSVVFGILEIKTVNGSTTGRMFYKIEGPNKLVCSWSPSIMRSKL